MAIYLTPGEIVPEVGETWVADGAGVKSREVVRLEGSGGRGEVGGPEVDVEGCEG